MAGERLDAPVGLNSVREDPTHAQALCAVGQSQIVPAEHVTTLLEMRPTASTHFAQPAGALASASASDKW